MKLGILGSGDVAQTLANGYLAKGYEVKLGTRSPEKLSDWHAKAGEQASVGSFAEAAQFGEVIFICTRGAAALSAIELAGVENFKGKTVIDVANSLDFSAGIPPKFMSTLGNSLGEQIQRALPEAKVVKAFNTINRTTMVDPSFGDETATMFIAGDDEIAKAETTKLAKEFGWDVEDLGGIDQAFFLEAFGMMWVNYAFRYDSWTHAFKFLKKQ